MRRNGGPASRRNGGPASPECAKSTTQSHRGAIYYVDLAVREGLTLEAALTEAKALDARRKEAGLDQDALDAAAQAGFSNAVFEFSEEEGQEILEEFYPPTNTDTSAKISEEGIPRRGLLMRLEQRASQHPTQSRT